VRLRQLLTDFRFDTMSALVARFVPGNHQVAYPLPYAW
jgi:hypothetical protein